MPPRITYWTGIWRPGLEAISNELATIRSALAPGAPIVSFSHGQRTSILPVDGAIRLSGRQTWTLRALAALLERRGQVTHAWGAIDDWHLLRSLGRRPLVFSAVLPGPAHAAAHYQHVSLFAAETDALAGALIDAGVPPARVRTVFPGIDLQEFSPAPPPEGRFRLLFASAPAHVEEFDARGIPLLASVARACPDIDVVLLWRNWGRSSAAAAALAPLHAPNLILEQRGDRSLADVFRSAHAVAFLVRAGFGKSCPNSVVEGLACGRPALVSEHCGLAERIDGAGAGVVVARDLDDAVRGVRAVQQRWTAMSAAARGLAEALFDVRRFVATYLEIYNTVA